MGEAQERLERALLRLEAAAARPKPVSRPDDSERLETRCATLEAAAREAVIRIDRLLTGETS